MTTPTPRIPYVIIASSGNCRAFGRPLDAEVSADRGVAADEKSPGNKSVTRSSGSSGRSVGISFSSTSCSLLWFLVELLDHVGVEESEGLTVEGVGDGSTAGARLGRKGVQGWKIAERSYINEVADYIKALMLIDNFRVMF